MVLSTREAYVCEMSGHIEHLKEIRDKSDQVNDTVVLDAAVQAMDVLERIRESDRLRSEVEREFGEDVWPT
jgi:hypothetical protein